MQRPIPLLALILAFFLVSILAAQQSSHGPYKILKRANVGGEGNWDYIWADVAGRRLYIPRRAPNVPPGAEGASSGVRTRLTVFNLDTLDPVGEIDGVGGNGAVVDPKSGHGFTSSKPISMFDTKTMKLIKTIDVNPAMFQPDGILFDAFNQHVYVFSHPTKDAMVIDAKDGTVLGSIDLGGVPEQGVSDGKGTLYVVMQDPQGGVAVADTRTMKTTTHYPFGDKAGGCNGLALDNRNHVLFAACARSGRPEDTTPRMVILSATDGKIITTLPLAGGSDGAAFNPATMEAFSSQGNGTMTIVKETSPTTFEVEQNLDTMNFARTNAFDSKTGHLFVMAEERGPAPPTPPGGRAGRGAAVPGTFTILEIGR
jgi:hypothetical protein